MYSSFAEDIHVHIHIIMNFSQDFWLFLKMHPIFWYTSYMYVLCILKVEFRKTLLWFLSYGGIVVVVHSLSCFWLFETPWAGVAWIAYQVPLSSTISRSLLKFMSIESVMLSNHLTFLLPSSSFACSVSQHQGIFQWVSSLPPGAKVDMEIRLYQVKCIHTGL